MEVPGRKGVPSARDQRPSPPEEDEQDECLCQPCLADGKQRAAHGYCSNCCVYLCRDCHDEHSEMKFTKTHVFLNKLNMPRGTVSNTTGDILTDVCPTHTGKITEYHCKTHDKLACTVCTMLEHRACSDVRYIPDIAHGTIGSRHCKDIQQTILDLQERAEHNVDQVVKSRKHLKEVNATYTEAVQDYRKQLVGIIDKLTAEAEEKKNAYMDKMTRQLDNAHTVSREQLDRLKSAKSDMDERIKADRANNLYVSLNRAETLITECRKSLQTLENDVLVPPCVFEKNTELYNLLKDVDSIGKLNESYPYLCDEINVHSPADSHTCGITSSLITADDRLVVVDYINKAVKLFDSSHRCVSRVTLPARPWDIAAVSRDELVVCFLAICKLQFISLTDCLTTARHIDTGVKCRSVAVCGSKLVFTVVQSGDLRIMSMDGNDIATIWTHPTHVLHYVRVGRDTDTLYVTHGVVPCGVTCVTVDGAVLWQYTAADLAWPRGLAVHTDGTIYRCGHNSHSVHHVAADGGMIDVLLSQGELMKPWAIYIEHVQNKMYVAEEQTNTIKVFKLRGAI